MIEILIIIILFALIVTYFLGKKSAEDKYKKKIEEALRGSRAGIKGIVSENIATLLPNFPGNLSEARFVGKPIDLLVFNGMDEENITEVVFVEVKTGKFPRLTNNERTLKDTISKRNVRWVEYEPDKEIAKNPEELI